MPPSSGPIAEQLLLGGIPAVRQAIDKQNDELKAAGKPAVKADSLLKVAEDLGPGRRWRPWRDRAEAAVAVVDELDLRDLRSVVNAAGDAGATRRPRHWPPSCGRRSPTGSRRSTPPGWPISPRPWRRAGSCGPCA